MKRILSTALAIVLFVGASQAQTTDGSGAQKHGRHGSMMKNLNLTEDQKAKFKSIREAEKTEMQALKNNGAADADKEARKALHEKYKAQFESVLTEDQKAKLKEEKKEGFAKHEHRSFGKDLNLSADQQAKLSSINSDFRTQMQALHSNTSLPADQKKAQIKELAKAHRTSLQGILTPEQLSKMQEERKHHKNESDHNL